VPLFAILTTIGLPIYLGFRYKMRRLEVEAGARSKQQGIDDDEVKRLEAENQRLGERVQNLESIVLNVDYELNQRLLRLAEAQSRIAPAGGSSVLAAVASAPDLPPPLRPGDTLSGRYRIEAEVGRGGMGIVYR